MNISGSGTFALACAINGGAGGGKLGGRGIASDGIGGGGIPPGGSGGGG